MDAKKNYYEDSQKELTVKQYFKNIWVAVTSLIKGMRITSKYIYAEPSVCIQYPEEKEVLPEKSRARLFNDVDNCIACLQCANACPVECIYIAAKRRDKDAPKITTKDGQQIRSDLTQYTIDTALCCYCGLCTTVCPTNCLTHTTDYEFASNDPADLKFDYLSPEIKAWKDRLIKE